ncbi:hypothetical protein BD310DRAFT_693959 [Dichomitus squalens]|uniref:Uncharacterized protein n=1 Tax=Dichomitus squalens TaxID=114155 RepID=A0A4Q9PLZ8_9APHY|nr:hypothetical protein BD310DRAFT_693959 [Dichomitus squalens]
MLSYPSIVAYAAHRTEHTAVRVKTDVCRREAIPPSEDDVNRGANVDSPSRRATWASPRLHTKWGRGTAFRETRPRPYGSGEIRAYRGRERRRDVYRALGLRWIGERHLKDGHPERPDNEEIEFVLELLGGLLRPCRHEKSRHMGLRKSSRIRHEDLFLYSDSGG